MLLARTFRIYVFVAKIKTQVTIRKKSSQTGFLNLTNATWTEKSEQYCDYRLDGKSTDGWLRIKQYTNGTLYIEAETEQGLSTLLSAAGQKVSSSGIKTTPTSGKSSGLIDITGTYIGTDESGKGDYFGPLVAAGVMVNDKTAAILQTLGVQDSKALTDKNIDAMFQDIVATVGKDAIAIVELTPAKYNDLYGKFKAQKKNLNHMLGWLHATVIENVLEKNTDLECSQAIADKFGKEFYITSQLKTLGNSIKLYQTPRAEENVGVAAASIVARHHFVRKIEALSSQFGIELPKGASGKVKAQAKKFITQHGKEQLGKVAKLHFKTTNELI